MMTNIEQLIPNAKGKDVSRETRVGLECICQYMTCFQSLSPLVCLCGNEAEILACYKCRYLAKREAQLPLYCV